MQLDEELIWEQAEVENVDTEMDTSDATTSTSSQHSDDTQDQLINDLLAGVQPQMGVLHVGRPLGERVEQPDPALLEIAIGELWEELG